MLNVIILVCVITEHQAFEAPHCLVFSNVFGQRAARFAQALMPYSLNTRDECAAFSSCARALMLIASYLSDQIFSLLGY